MSRDAEGDRVPDSPSVASVMGSTSHAVPAPSSEFDERHVVRELYWLCGLPIVVSVVYAISLKIGNDSALGDVLATSAVALIALGGALSNARLVRSAWRIPSARDLFVTLLVALVAWPTLQLAFYILQQLGFVLYDDYSTPYVQDGWPLWVAFAGVALITPLSEEVLFRGLIQPKLGQLITSREAVIVQAALFSALHLSPVILATHFAMGLAFGWLRQRSGSLLPGIALHGAWNAWVVWASLG